METSKRIDYIDALKGFAILWIVWWHTCHPSFVSPYYHVPIFFVVAGIFFKPYPFKTLLQKRTHKTLIPFIFFYLISYPYRIILHLWDHRTLDGFLWNSIFDVFKCMPNGDYLFVNVPIWFLLCLFIVSIFYHLLYKTPLWLKIIYIVLVLFASDLLRQISTPFFINDAIIWTAYYAIGDICGKQLITLFHNKKYAFFVLIFCSILYIIIRIVSIPEILISFYNNLLTIIFIFGILALFSLIGNSKPMWFLRYYGKNSLIVLGFHVLALIIFQRIITKLYGSVNYWGGFAVFILTSLSMAAIIPFAKKYFSRFLGQ